MITPSKFISFDQSLLSKLHFVLEALPEVTNIKELYQRVEKNFEDISEFIVCIDTLYVLGRIDIARSTGEILDVN